MIAVDIPQHQYKLNVILDQAKGDVEAAVRSAYTLGRDVENQRSVHLRDAMTELANLSGADTWSPAWHENAVGQTIAKVRELAAFKPDGDSLLFRRTQALASIRDALGLDNDLLHNGREHEIVSVVRGKLQEIQKLERRNGNQGKFLREVAEIVGLDHSIVPMEDLAPTVRRMLDEVKASNQTLHMKLRFAEDREAELRQQVKGLVAEVKYLKESLAYQYERGRRAATREILKATLNDKHCGPVELVLEDGKIDVREPAQTTCGGGC